MTKITPKNVLQAAERLAGIANRTPVITSRTLNRQTNCELYLKCENFQRAGAFKFRGAYNAVSQLRPQQRSAGVITHSSGNHAQGLALAARLLDVAATVVMPEDAPTIKREATAGYGATIISCPAFEREVVTARLVAEKGYTLIHPYDNDQIIAGQGTAALELFEEVGPLDLLFVPVGGGGLISGSALAAAARGQGCRVIGVEPAIAADAGQSWRTGQIVTLDHVPATLADGLRTRHIGQRNLAVMSHYVHDMTTASEDDILETMAFLWERLKIIVEPSAAVALAPVFTNQYPVPAGQRVGIILSGGNADIGPVSQRLFADATSTRNRIGNPSRSGGSLAADPAKQPQVLVVGEMDETGLAILNRAAKVDVRPAMSDEELQAAIGQYHALIVDDHTRVSGQIIEYGYRLRAIGCTGARLDNIDVSAARALGVEVRYSPGGNALALAEHTLSLLLMLSSFEAGQAGWQSNQGLAGKIFGLIGFGRIGRQVAQRARAFDMRVLVNQPRLTPELALDQGVEVVDLPDLLRQADFVSLHVPFKAETQTLIGLAELEQMKPTAYLINSAHTDLVDDSALLLALDSGQIAGAALATFAPQVEGGETRPTAALRQHPKVIAARHVTAFRTDLSSEAAAVVAQQVVDSLHIRRPNETLSLEIVPIEQVMPHEEIDDKRVDRLMDRLEEDGRLVNPPVVTYWNDGYVILDGATRYSALRRLAFPYVIVQVVPADSDEFDLHTWYHVISSTRPVDDLFTRLAQLPDLQLDPITAGQLPGAFQHPESLCYFLDRNGRATLAKASSAADKLAVMNEVVTAYTQWGTVERTLLTDLGRLLGQFPGMAAVAVFPQFKPETIFEVASRGELLPAGLTRFVIPGRILRLNADLARLKEPEPLAAKRAWFNQFLEEKLARSRLRYYQEPVVLLDE
jgi:threo-3-hydroxy-L-aspartate ammonia-lyase